MLAYLEGKRFPRHLMLYKVWYDTHKVGQLQPAVAGTTSPSWLHDSTMILYILIAMLSWGHPSWSSYAKIALIYGTRTVFYGKNIIHGTSLASRTQCWKTGSQDNATVASLVNFTSLWIESSQSMDLEL